MSSIQPSSPCQSSSGEGSPYLLITIRVLAAVGFSFLLRLLYQRMIGPLFLHRSSLDILDTVAEENIGLDLNNTASASRLDLELDFNGHDDGDLGICRPEPVFHPRIAAAEENIGVDLNNSVSASQVSLDLDFGSHDDGDLSIRRPEPAYHPRGHL